MGQKLKLPAAAPEQVCTRCGASKPATKEFWVRNRPNYSRGRELPRTYHKTCKSCESVAKTASWASRNELKAEWAKQQDAEMTRLGQIAAAESERVRQHNLQAEAERVSVEKDYRDRPLRLLGEDG